MYQTQRQLQAPPAQILEGLLAACIVVGILAGVVFGIRLYNSIVSTKN